MVQYRRYSWLTNSAMSLEDPSVSVNVGQGIWKVLHSNPSTTACALSICLSRQTWCFNVDVNNWQSWKIEDRVTSVTMFIEMVDGVTLKARKFSRSATSIFGDFQMSQKHQLSTAMPEAARGGIKARLLWTHAIMPLANYQGSSCCQTLSPRIEAPLFTIQVFFIVTPCVVVKNCW